MKTEKKNVLNEYIEKQGLVKKFFAKKIGVSENTFQKYLKGISKPDIDTAFLIEFHTHGKVKAKDWIGDSVAAQMMK